MHLDKITKKVLINGAIYIFNRKLLKYNKIVSANKHSTFEMPKIRSIDIDDYQDLIWWYNIASYIIELVIIKLLTSKILSK